jgi:D-3-phosphoglycerate dehydrogenase
MSEREQGPFRVTITDTDLGSVEIEEIELQGLGTVALAQCRTEEQVIAASRGADALLVQYAPITAKVIDSLSSCKVISRYGVGIDMIDLAAASRRGIIVCNVPDYCQEEVSDHACALILALARKLKPLDRSVHRGEWNVRVARPMNRLAGLHLGLLGFGKIARMIAHKLSGFDLKISAFDPYLAPEAFRAAGVASVGFSQILEQSDILSLHLPLTTESTHILGAKELKSLKRGAFIVNTSRGPLIDENALADALREGRVGGAALDVTEQEPLQAGCPLLPFENVIITPHAAFYSETSIEELRRQTARAVAHVLRGEPKGAGDTYAVVNQKEIGPKQR